MNISLLTMKKIELLIFTCALIYGTFGVTQSSNATIFLVSDFEGKACDSVIVDGERADDTASRVWDIYYEGLLTGTQYEPHIRCSGSIIAPSGLKYVEWLASSVTSGTGVEVPWNTPINLTMGTTYYLAGFFRFDHINGVDVWHDGNNGPDSFDKLFEFGAAGTGSNTRWGISSGWASGIYSNGVDHKFVFDPWCADSAFTECQNSVTYDHKWANVSPYNSTTNPPVVDYGKWYAVVLEVTMQTDTTGNAKMWINGVKTHDHNVATTGPNPKLERIFINGTVGQPAYDAPLHYRRMDRLMFSDSLSDIQAAGLMSDPELGTFAPSPDTTAPSVPGSLGATVVSQSQTNLSWSASTDPVVSGATTSEVTGYQVERCQGVGCTAFTQVGTPTTTSFNNTSLLARTTYQFRVRAVDGTGNVSGYSSVVSAATLSSTPMPAPAPGSTVVTLSPTQDTFLNIDTAVYAADTSLNTYTFPVNSVANAILMKFNLTSIPAGSTIFSAVLNLTLTEADTTADTLYTIPVHKVIGVNPNLTLATGYTYDGTNFWSGGSSTVARLAQGNIGPAIDTQNIDKTLGVKTWTVTSLIQDWLTNPSTNFGLLLNSDTSRGADRYRFFASMEHAVVSMRPSLTVTYTAQSTPPPDTTPPAVPGNVRVL